MPDELPSGSKAIYIFLEMIALGFALEAVTAFMRGDVWWKWSGALLLGVLFLAGGVKSQQIRLKMGGRLAYYLSRRPLWMVVFVLFSLYFLQKPVVLDLIVRSHQRFQGWLGYALFGSVGALLLAGFWWVTGAILKPTSRPAATERVTTPSKDYKPPTLLDLFKNDFSNTLRSSDSEDAIAIKWADGTTTKIKRQVYMDFPAKAKFIGFYIPSAHPPSADVSSNKTVAACLKLLEADAIEQTFDHVSKQVYISSGYGDQMTSIQELTFSGRVLIYHEEFLSIPQKADIIKAYEAKRLGVQFMGSDYLGPKVIAWHQQQDAKGTR